MSKIMGVYPPRNQNGMVQDQQTMKKREEPKCGHANCNESQSKNRSAISKSMSQFAEIHSKGIAKPTDEVSMHVCRNHSDISNCEIAMSHSPKIAIACCNEPKLAAKVLRNQPMRSSYMYVAITVTSAIAKSQ